MSLINEALRKARQAASEHESKQPAGPFQPARAYPSRRSGRRVGPLAMALIAVAAGVIGAVAVWWYLGDHQIASEEVSLDAPTTGVERGGSAIPVEGPSEPNAEAARADLAPTAAVSPDAEVMTVSRGDAKLAPRESLPPKAATVAPVTGPNGERVFVIEANLGYASLNLGYIVSRSTNPFAEINGREVRIGSEIEGFVVEAIEADRVVLRDKKGLLILRVP